MSLEEQERELRAAIESSEAYLVHARGKDRRMEQRYLSKKRRQLRELREGVATTGEAGIMAAPELAGTRWL